MRRANVGRFAVMAVMAVMAAWTAPRVAGAAEGDEPVRASTHMVVAANPHAASAGLRILREGGGAVDAAIAVQLVLSLVEPQSSGIGGGAFMLYFEQKDGAQGTGEVTAYEGRETAPAAATPDMFLGDNGEPLSFVEGGFGGLPVGVPGVMRMLEMAHRDHGRLPWADLFAPAIELAEQGFEISPRLYFLLDRFASIARASAFKTHFYDEQGRARETGQVLVNPDYARSLRLLAAEGADAMYTGALAEAIVAAVRDNDIGAGGLTLEDLRDYEAHEGEAVCSDYRTWRVCGPALPSSGAITVQQILGMLSRFDLGALEADPARSIHLIAEASRLAFADRNFYLADPAFVDVPVAGLLRPEYLASRASLIGDRAMSAVEPGRPGGLTAWNYAPSAFSELASTSHFSIVDRYGDAVSMTTSVQGAFGSQLMVGGFILNNQLTDFSFEPEIDGMPVANRSEAGKRPLSSMTPTLVFDADDRLTLRLVGSPGGTRIINYVTQALVGVLDWGLNVQEAVAAPHFLAQRGVVELEERTAVLERTEALEALGHRVSARNLNSGLHAIYLEHGEDGRVLAGGVDPRREGVALGD